MSGITYIENVLLPLPSSLGNVSRQGDLVEEVGRVGVDVEQV